jgi:hypothetical protein
MGSFPKEDGGGRHSCFLGGTRIRTPKGEVDVAMLKAGDLVVTVSGQAKPIKEISHRRYERASHESWPVDILPIKVARSALGPSTPSADLFLSPAHALYLDGLLVPVGTLVNGRRIIRCASLEADCIEYFHIELFAHDVIFAEGVLAESLLLSSAGATSDQFAPRESMGWRAVVGSRLRSAASPLIDRRRAVDVVWDRIAERAETELAA